MFKNYITVAIRNLARNKLYALINVSGLAIAIAFCILALLFVREEHSYDQFHKNGDHLYRVVRGKWTPIGFKGDPETPLPMADFLNTFPEVQSAVRIEPSSALVQYQNKAFRKTGVEAYPAAFEIFTFPFVAGDLKTALSRPDGIIITQSLAQQFFGTSPALGKALTLRAGAPKEHIVTGVIKNIPTNSSLKFDYAIPHPLTIEGATATASQQITPPGQKDRRWYSSNTSAYVLLKPNVDPDAFAKKFTPLVLERSYKTTYHLQPITQVHLDTNIGGATNPQYGYILTAISLIVLLIACINFMNLSIGSSVTRAKEVGVRKVIGAKRQQLIKQFWSESLLLCTCSVALGLALTEIFLPMFNTLANKQLAITIDGQMGLALLALIFTVGMLAGIYPALILSGFDPINTLKGTLKVGKSSWAARGLVVTQFALSIGFVIATLMMSRQLDLLQTKNVTHNQAPIVVIPTYSGRSASHKILDIYRSALSQNPNVINITGSRSFRRAGRRTVGPRESDQRFEAPHLFIDHNYLPTMGIELAGGRNFSPDRPADTKSVIVNEALVRHFNLKNPIGQSIPGPREIPIIGVVKDYHYDTLYDPIKPMVIEYKTSTYRYVFVRINQHNVANTLTTLKSTWQTVVPDIPFEYSFLDERLNRYYQSEMRWRSIIQYAAGFAIFIACLGIFGLTTLTVNRRIKEIGIRKVLGASVPSVVVMIPKSFIQLIIIANLIAWPLAYYIMEEWLANFAYRIDQELLTFAIGGLLALLIACATISIQALKAARRNPVDALRYE